MRNILLAFACAVALAGCAATTAAPAPRTGSTAAPAASAAPADPLAQIAQFTVTDLQAADADAVANNDQIAHACYPALIKFVQSLPNGSGLTVSGAFSAFQKARDVGSQVQAGVPTYLTLGCAPLVVDTQALVARLAVIGGGAAATAGMIVPVPVMPVP